MLPIPKYRYVGKHRAPSSTTRRIATGTLVAGSTLAVLAPSASAQETAISAPEMTFASIDNDTPVKPAMKLTLVTAEHETSTDSETKKDKSERDDKVDKDGDDLESAKDGELAIRGVNPIASKTPIDYKSLGDSQAALSTMFASIAQMQERIGAEQAAAEEAARPKVVSPAAGVFTSGFGPRWGTFHAGIDIANSEGTPILSVMDGVVLESGPASGYGNWIRIKHDDGSVAIYGHMSSLYVSAGQYVKAGETIAGMGNLGFSTGTHLHFEIHSDGYTAVDPLPWFSARGVTI